MQGPSIQLRDIDCRHLAFFRRRACGDVKGPFSSFSSLPGLYFRRGGRHFIDAHLENPQCPFEHQDIICNDNTDTSEAQQRLVPHEPMSRAGRHDMH